MRQLLNCFTILTMLAVGDAANPCRVHKGPLAQQAHKVHKGRWPSRRTGSARARRTARSCRASGPEGRSRARAALASRDRYGHRSLWGR